LFIAVRATITFANIHILAAFCRRLACGLQLCTDAKKGGPAAGEAAIKSRFKMMPDEAMKILNIEKASFSRATTETQYKKYYELNDPGKGGSFYLQSKIYRAKEVLDKELASDSVAEEKDCNGNKEDKR
jgi:mitochondrial import inner membrane translocase subunit TIM16